ncbi:MAG: hypothetical protein A2341_14905 [Deltaproteobacteria bacterium RIFOXYB12_FULL_58_9]|nr:MAG: hypothetical protein A2341_14905 [Deltaproteobacteria bacterium RIFOXYB12_FULL_58_9]
MTAHQIIKGFVIPVIMAEVFIVPVGVPAFAIAKDAPSAEAVFVLPANRGHGASLCLLSRGASLARGCIASPLNLSAMKDAA